MASFDIRFENRRTHLYAYVEGEESMANSLAYMALVVDEAKACQLDRVLVEENLEGQLTDSQMFEVTSRFLEMGLGALVKMAFVDRHASHGSGNELGELVARNRGINVRIFRSVEAGEKWLLEEPNLLTDDGASG